MSELTWIIDPASGDLVVEGLTPEQAAELSNDLLPPGRELNCARPLGSLPLVASRDAIGPSVRVARVYHGSVVDGPGRRSVLQVQGCPVRCRFCGLGETHDTAGGVLLTVAEAVRLLLDPAGEPRDGVTVTGGEPFAQPEGLATLLRQLKICGVHTTVYSGFTLEVLARRPEPAVREALQLTDLLIDGPFVAALADSAGEWRGSRNQRLLLHPARLLVAEAPPAR